MPDTRDAILAEISRWEPRDDASRSAVPVGGEPAWREFLARHGSIAGASAVEILQRASLEPGGDPVRDAAEVYLRAAARPFVWSIALIDGMRPESSVLGLPRRAGVLAVTADALGIGDDDWTPSWTRCPIDTRVLERFATPYEGPLQSLVALPDGRWVTGAGDEDPRVIVWDASGAIEVELGDPEGRFGRVHALADGSLLVCDGALARWRIGEATPLWIHPRDREGDPIEWLATVPELRAVVIPRDVDWSQPSVSSCAMLELADGRERAWVALALPLRFRGAPPCALGDRLYGVAATGDRLVALALRDGSVHASAPLATPPTVLAGRGAVVVLGDDAGWIQVLGADDLAVRGRWCAHDGRVVALAFADDGRTLWSLGRDRRVHRWSLATPMTTAPAFDDTRLDPGALGRDATLGLAPDGALWLAERRVRTSTRLADPTPQSHASRPAVIAAADGELAAVIDAPRTGSTRSPVRLRLVELAAPRIVAELALAMTDADLGHGPHDGRFALLPARGWLVERTETRPRLWSLADGHLGPELDGALVKLVALVATGDDIVALAIDGSVFRWRLPIAVPTHGPAGDAPAAIAALAIDATGHQLAWSTRAGDVVVASMLGAPVLRFSCTGVRGLAFAGDDRLVVARDTGGLEVHALADGRCLATWRHDASWTGALRCDGDRTTAIDTFGRVTELGYVTP